MSPNYNSKQSSKAQILPLTQLKWVTCIKIHLRGCHEVQKFTTETKTSFCGTLSTCLLLL